MVFELWHLDLIYNKYSMLIVNRVRAGTELVGCILGISFDECFIVMEVRLKEGQDHYGQNNKFFIS